MIKKSITIILVLALSISFSQNNVSLNLLKAIAEYNLSNYDTALFYANKINDAENIQRAIQIKADSYFNKKQYDKALSQYLKLTKKLDSNSINIARIYSYKKDYDNTNKWLIKHLKSKYKINPGIIKTDPFFKDFSTTKYWRDVWMKDWYSPLEEKIFDVEYLRYKKKYVDALDESDEILAQKKDCYRIYAERAKIYKKLNDIDNQVFSWKNAIKYNPGNSHYLLEYGKALLDKTKYKKALQAFQKAEEIDKYLPQVYYYLALAYFRQNQFEKAKQQIDIYRKISPHDGDAIWLAGYVYKDSGDYQKAIDIFNEGIRSGKIQKGFYVGKGEALFELERYGEAARAFTMELDLSPRNGYLYYMRGLSHISRDNKVEACKDWHHASKLGYFQADDYISRYCK